MTGCNEFANFIRYSLEDMHEMNAGYKKFRGYIRRRNKQL